jgi:hypothetical protein
MTAPCLRRTRIESLDASPTRFLHDLALLFSAHRVAVGASTLRGLVFPRDSGER